MTQLLTDQEIKEALYKTACCLEDRDIAYSRAIEAAVVAKLSKQEPVAYYQLEFFGGSPQHCQVGDQCKDDDGVFPLYAAPVPPEFDYKRMLVAYIGHVGECEGTDFLGRSADDGICGLTFEEVEELRRLIDEDVRGQ